ncbi:hypothetical protein HDU97_007569 [Phlyctochytrium planicorne]|nr:hypothetical protein HDU97_007569 [Phlyctochytrium planicorne]
MSRTMSMSSDVSSCSTLVSGQHPPSPAQAKFLASPPTSPYMPTIIEHSSSSSATTATISTSIDALRHSQKHLQLQQQQQLVLDTAEDLKMDAGLDLNERRARAAVRFAMRNAKPLLERFRVEAIVGFGSNGVVLRALEFGKINAAPLAIKIIYKSNSTASQQQQKPNEIALLDLITRSSPHPNVLSHMMDWEDSRHFYLVTELHGAKPSASTLTATPSSTPDLIHDDESDDDELSSSPATPAMPVVQQEESENTPLIFWNQRLNRREHLTVSAGSTDLWSWSLAMSQRNFLDELDPSFPASRFTTPSVTYRLNPPPMSLVRGIFAQVASGVEHLHAVGVAHGDLKEENILLDGIDTNLALQMDVWRATEAVNLSADAVAPIETQLAAQHAPVALVCDFGHAMVVKPHNATHAQRIVSYGTRELTAPEMLSNLRLKQQQQQQQHRGLNQQPVTADPFAADVFALGMCLYSLLHGPGCLPPAVHETVRGGASLGLVDGVYPYGPVRGDLGVEAREVLEGMLMVDPAQRWTMVDVVNSKFVGDVLAARRA